MIKNTAIVVLTLASMGLAYAAVSQFEIVQELHKDKTNLEKALSDSNKTEQVYKQIILQQKEQLDKLKVPMSMGASYSQAKHIVQMSAKYSLDLEMYSFLGRTESKFGEDMQGHANGVVGIYGWNTKVWQFKDLDPRKEKDQIEAGARILSHYLAESEYDYELAIWKYKSYNAQGKLWANQYFADLKTFKKEGALRG